MRLAPIRVPPELLLAETDRLDVQVVVERDGRATVDDPLVPDTLRAAIAEALRESELTPAHKDGEPVAARVRVRLLFERIDPAPPPQPPAPDPPVPAPAAAAPDLRVPPPTAAPAAAEPERSPDTATPTYGARGRVEQPIATGQRIESKEMRELPGGFGDPFRVMDALPGVVPVLSGVPYVYVRGAPPAGTVYYYDGIQVPVLFHLALGPAIVHPALIDNVDFYPGVAPARYGRYTGGVLAGGARPRGAPAAIGGELELRLIDLNGMIEVPLGDGGSLRAAGRYGYPGILLNLLSDDASLAYWDYQTQLSLPLSKTDRFELTWFGSFDRAGSSDSRLSLSSITLEFHRAELRMIREIGRWELGSALQFGYERSEFEGGMSVNAGRVGPRVYAAWRGEDGLRARFGADLFGTVGSIDSPIDQDGSNIEIHVPSYAADVAGRSVFGVYGELALPIARTLTLDLGVRSDLWFTGSRAQSAVDPRLSLSWRSSPILEWRIAAGLGHQPAVFMVPLPGIADVGLDHGLQTAVQGEAGVTLRLPAKLRFESQVYAQYMTGMILPDLALDQTQDCDAFPPNVAAMYARCSNGYPRARAKSYGLEVFLHREATETLSGWLSYTLGWADAHADEGFDFTPSFDVRHLVNLVLQYDFGGGFGAGARLHYRSGKMGHETFLREGPIRYEQRLPSFVRTDLQLSYAWETSWADLRLALEWLNVTLSREATGIDCTDGVLGTSDPLTATPCRVTWAPAIFFPNLGLRAMF